MLDEEYDRLTRQLNELRKWKQTLQSLSVDVEKSAQAGRNNTILVDAGALGRLLLVLNNN